MHAGVLAREFGAQAAVDGDVGAQVLAGEGGEVGDEGVDVRGYLHWSALDNYEWGSYAPTFGLIGWDRETFERHPKPSLAWLGEVARRGGLD